MAAVPKIVKMECVNTGSGVYSFTFLVINDGDESLLSGWFGGKEKIKDGTVRPFLLRLDAPSSGLKPGEMARTERHIIVRNGKLGHISIHIEDYSEKKSYAEMVSYPIDAMIVLVRGFFGSKWKIEGI